MTENSDLSNQLEHVLTMKHSSAQFAQVLKSYYDALVQVGFSKDTALALTSEFMRMALTLATAQGKVEPKRDP